MDNYSNYTANPNAANSQTDAGTKICQNCGAAVAETVAFCTKCGAPMQEAQPQYQQAQQPQYQQMPPQMQQPTIIIQNTNNNTNTNENAALGFAASRARNKWVALLLCFSLVFLVRINSMKAKRVWVSSICSRWVCSELV